MDLLVLGGTVKVLAMFCVSKGMSLVPISLTVTSPLPTRGDRLPIRIVFLPHVARVVPLLERRPDMRVLVRNE